MPGPFAPRRPTLIGAAAGTCLAVGIAGWAPPAGAQDPGGMRLTIDITPRIAVESNPGLDIDNPGTRVTASIPLRFGFDSETRRQSLSVFGGLTPRVFDDPTRDDRFDLGDRDIGFAYQRNAATAMFDLSGSYARSDIDFMRPLEDFLVAIEDEDGEIVDVELDLPDDLENLDGRGTRERLELDTRLELGMDRRSGITFDASLRETTYSEEVAATDTRRLAFSAAPRLTISPVTEVTITANWSRFENDNPAQTRRDRRSLIFGIDHAFSRTLGLSAGLGPNRVETREFGETDTVDGFDSNFTLSYDRSRGDISLSGSSRVNQDGTRTEARIGGNFERPVWRVGGDVGVTRSPQGDVNMVGRIDYRQDLPRGDFGLQARRAVATRADDQDRLRTVFRADYEHTINNISGIGLEASFVRIGGEDGAGQTERVALGATYRREFTEDWTMNLGYRYRSRSIDKGDAQAHEVFLFLDRGFNFRL